jgi:hypothetical protein
LSGDAGKPVRSISLSAISLAFSPAYRGREERDDEGKTLQEEEGTDEEDEDAVAAEEADVLGCL